MYAVIFEVTLNPQGKTRYFELAKQLKESLMTINGFISVERFQSLNHDDKLLSLSIWENEAAIRQWREHEAHSLAQKLGKQSLFDDYLIRVCTVTRIYGKEKQALRQEVSTPCI